jgi:lipid II:glycine glycyltransferase (peptidoglycan interpeptide bridge formation enzyme)
MITIKKIENISHEAWDENVDSFAQSFAWAESRKALGYPVLELGIYKDGICLSCILVVLKSIPHTQYFVGNIYRGDLYDEHVYEALKIFGRENNICTFTFEPNVFEEDVRAVSQMLVKTDRHQFALWSPFIDLTEKYKDLEALFSKTVRNETRLAVKNGITIEQGVSDELYSHFIQLTTSEKAKKQYVGYTEEYYKGVFEALKKEDQARLFVAYDVAKNPVATAMIFIFKGTVTYAYAGSLGRSTPKGAMYLLIASIIKTTQTEGCHTFDLFGSLDPAFVGEHSWKGFTQFKKSFGPVFKKYIGAYDLVVIPHMYYLYKVLIFIKKLFK